MPVFLNSKRNEKIELQEKVLMQYLLLQQREEGIPKGRILEAGAGFGRIAKLLLERFHENIDEYVLLDISKDQLTNARIYLEKNLDAAVLEKEVDVKYVQCDFMDFNADKFDLVLAVEVLMHVLPKDIQKAIDVLISLSQRNVLTIDWYEEENKKPKKIAAHNTLYNYPRLYMNNKDVESFKRIPIEKVEQSIFHVKKKKEKVLGWLIRSL